VAREGGPSEPGVLLEGRSIEPGMTRKGRSNEPGITREGHPYEKGVLRESRASKISPLEPWTTYRSARESIEDVLEKLAADFDAAGIYFPAASNRGKRSRELVRSKVREASPILV
jgi:hypothetical protein